MKLRTLLLIMCLAISFIPIGIISGIEGFKSESVMLIGLIFCVTFIVSYIISLFITRPIEKLTHNIDQISKGKLDVNLNYSELQEINKLTDSLNRVMASLKLAVHKVGVKKGEIFEDAVKAKEIFEKKQKDLLDSINGWAWEINDKGVFSFCSNNVSSYLGYTPEELKGKNLFDFVSEEYIKQTKHIFNEAVKTKTSIRNLRYLNKTKNGKKLFTQTNGMPYYDETGKLIGFRGVNADITNEQDQELQIKMLNQQIQDLKLHTNKLLNNNVKSKKTIKPSIEITKQKWSENDFDSVFLFDEKANIVECNENLYKSLGYSKSEILSLKIFDIDALETQKDIESKIKEVKKNGMVTFKTIYKKKDGTALLVHENMQYLEDRKMFKAIAREDSSLRKK